MTSAYPAVGDIIAGRFRLDRLLGEGGMGTVWAATHVLTKKTIALKLLKHAHESVSQRKRFVREARAACAVQHPNVREIYDVIEIDEGAPVMIMEFLVGESLAERLRREGQLPVRDACRILVQVVSAVGTAHALGIIHRDLKPENIFLSDEADPRVKVLDFGIAKLQGSEAQQAETMVTQSGVMLGTPCFMSPEQIFGEKDIDHRTDIWAIGLILYQMLTGVLPTAADNVGQVMKLVVTKPIRPVEELVPDLPADLAQLVGRMLARARKSRPASLLEVQHVLTRHTNVTPPSFGEPKAARSPSEPLSTAPAPDARTGNDTFVEAEGNDTLGEPDGDDVLVRNAEGSAADADPAAVESASWREGDARSEREQRAEWVRPSSSGRRGVAAVIVAALAAALGVGIYVASAGPAAPGPAASSEQTAPAPPSPEPASPSTRAADSSPGAGVQEDPGSSAELSVAAAPDRSSRARAGTSAGRSPSRRIDPAPSATSAPAPAPAPPTAEAFKPTETFE